MRRARRRATERPEGIRWGLRRAMPRTYLSAIVVAMVEVDLSSVLSATADGVALRVKVVPGASRTKLAGLLGDRLKLAVAAPPEAGKANRAVCALLAETFHVSPRDVTVVAGRTQPTKTVEVMDLDLCSATETLRILLR